jgi:hypothetical protein
MNNILKVDDQTTIKTDQQDSSLKNEYGSVSYMIGKIVSVNDKHIVLEIITPVILLALSTQVCSK